MLRYSIVGLLIAWPLLIGLARAHSCCYSVSVTGVSWHPDPVVHCIHYKQVWYESRELWPTSNEPDHDHFWVVTVWMEETGPYPVYDCTPPENQASLESNRHMRSAA